MTLSLADRSTKTSGIKIMSQVGVDPDLDKASRIKVSNMKESFLPYDFFYHINRKKRKS